MKRSPIADEIFDQIALGIARAGSMTRIRELLEDLYQVAVCEGKIQGTTELRDKLQEVFTEPLLEQSVDNVISLKAAKELARI